MLPNVTLEDLLDAGAHFGHQTSRWHPKMGKFIFGEKNGIHLIDLKKTLYCLLEAYEVVRRTTAGGGSILFVGTKKQAKNIMKEEAERCGMYFVSERWLGGMLTNFRTIRTSVERMKQIERNREDGTFDKLTKKEVLELENDYERLNKVLGGIRNMDRLPDLLFIVDAKKEDIPIREAKKLHLPIVAICDTNTDPDLIDYPIPANDDAIKSIKLIAGAIADAARDGMSGSQLLERIDEEARNAELAFQQEQESKIREDENAVPVTKKETSRNIRKAKDE